MRCVVDQSAQSRRTNQTTAPAAVGSRLHYLAKDLAKLLETARRELDNDREAAKASLVIASSILQSEIERSSGANRSRPGVLTNWRKLGFGRFELSIAERVLRRDGQVLSLGGRALDILIYLADRAGEVIAKKELIDYVWPDVTVEEGSLRVHVAAIRKALGNGQFGNRYIANVKGRGYSFVGTVVWFDNRTENGNAASHQGRLPARLITIGHETVASPVNKTPRSSKSTQDCSSEGGFIQDGCRNFTA
jgi:DNA-binding winged helix-turn-helix (wHTH) protein